MGIRSQSARDQVRALTGVVCTIGLGEHPCRFSVIGGNTSGGTFSEFVVVERNQVVPVPPYLPLVYAAAWPAGGITAWR